MLRLSLATILVLWSTGIGLTAGPCTVTPSPAWKSSIDFPADPFRVNSAGSSEPGWIKFTILTCDPGTVYFQDGHQYEFHYDFAVNELDPFLGISVAQFDALTRDNLGRQALLGAIVLPPQGIGFPPPPTIPEYGIQLVSDDPLDVQLVIDTFATVRGAINADPGVEALYFPTFEQLGPARQDAATLAANGITISSAARWSDGNSCYSEGWALGRARFVAADQIEAAFLAGQLAPDDILITDGVPSDMPLVAGVLSLAPAAPNSHVAILAQTFGIPFAFLALSDDAALAQSLVGRKIVVEAFRESGGLDLGNGCAVRMLDVEEELTSQQIDEILALKAPPPLHLAPVAAFGSLGADTTGLTPADIDHFGGKAANFGFLRRSIPNDSPVALAISFDLWTEFLDQTLPGGMTLRQTIDGILASYPSYPPPDMQQLANDLAGVRAIFEETAQTSFTSARQAELLTLLQSPTYGFDPFKKLRFRSSTNVEDSDRFTGAGLYDSKSGCLADDLDGDGSGPGLCDPTENNEKGVFRAIRKVFASFYNDNAFLERLRHGVDESDVGMALLVHHSFPDSIELANGVATYERRAGFSDEALLVTHDGDTSVTNPPPGAIPEEVEATIFNPSSVSVLLVTETNLLPIGSTVMDWTTDYVSLGQLLRAAADEFQSGTGKTEFVLDFEYKKMAPGGGALPSGGLVVKQIREIPQPDDTPSITPFLINAPTRLTTLAREPGRVRSEWLLETRNTWLDASGLNSGTLYTDMELLYTDGCRVRQLEGAPATLPSASHAYDAQNAETVDGWYLGNLPNPRTYSLETRGLDLLVSPAESPFVTLAELAESGPGVRVRIDHQNPVVTSPGGPNTTLTETTALVIPADGFPGGINAEPTPGVTVESSMFLRPAPIFCGGCIPVASRFIETTISGLTTQPIILDDFASQSYTASNHAFFETYSFEPILDPGLSAQTLAELEAQDIRMIRVHRNNIVGSTTLSLLNDDDFGQSCVPSSASGSVGEPGQLVLARSGNDELSLSWGSSCIATDDDFAVYSGTIGDFTSHTPLTCHNGGATQRTIPLEAGDRYYVVVARGAHFEGSHGVASSGPRAPGAAACTATNLTTCP